LSDARVRYRPDVKDVMRRLRSATHSWECS
jgi:hypothetical protein